MYQIVAPSNPTTQNTPIKSNNRDVSHCQHTEEPITKPQLAIVL